VISVCKDDSKTLNNIRPRIINYYYYQVNW